MLYFHVHSIPGVSWLKVENCRWWKPGYSYNRTFDGSLFWFLCPCCLDFSSDHLMSHNTGSQPYYTGSGHILGHTRSQPYHTGSYKVPTILFAAGFLWQSRNSLHLLRCRRNQVIQTSHSHCQFFIHFIWFYAFNFSTIFSIFVAKFIFTLMIPISKDLVETDWHYFLMFNF